MKTAQARETQEEMRPDSTSIVPAAASGLAGLILESNLRNGQSIEIPSLGITLTQPETNLGSLSESDAESQGEDESAGAMVGEAV